MRKRACASTRSGARSSTISSWTSIERPAQRIFDITKMRVTIDEIRQRDWLIKVCDMHGIDEYIKDDAGGATTRRSSRRTGCERRSIRCRAPSPRRSSVTRRRRSSCRTICSSPCTTGASTPTSISSRPRTAARARIASATPNPRFNRCRRVLTRWRAGRSPRSSLSSCECRSSRAGPAVVRAGLLAAGVSPDRVTTRICSSAQGRHGRGHVQPGPEHRLPQSGGRADGLTRRRAKDVNFAKAYGAGVKKFALMTGMTLEEAAAVMGQYDGEMPFVKELNEICEREAQNRGYIRMIDKARARTSTTGSRAGSERRASRGWAPSYPMAPCRIEEARERCANDNHPWFGKAVRRADTRKAMNRLIQGSAARQTRWRCSRAGARASCRCCRCTTSSRSRLKKEKDGKRDWNADARGNQDQRADASRRRIRDVVGNREVQFQGCEEERMRCPPVA
jgi:hypothetical protein